MMAKTFDNVTDAAAINFQLLISNLTMSIDALPIAPPPFSLLSALRARTKARAPLDC